MPEGDTIHRTAESMRRVLLSRPVERIEVPRARPPLPAVGSYVDGIEARGKHLLVRFSDGLVLHTHLRMTGSWHLYRTGDRWRLPRAAMRAVVAVPEVEAVCFRAPVVEILDDAAVRRHPALRALGPDLCLPRPDLDEALARMRRLVDPSATVGEVLLDQRIASGVGNVYRSEVCFLVGIHPATPLRAVAEHGRRLLLATAADLLRANLSGRPRTTVEGAPAGTLYVYGRAGEPCRRCRSPIASDRLGAPPRVVYWCPGCQPPHG